MSGEAKGKSRREDLVSRKGAQDRSSGVNGDSRQVSWSGCKGVCDGSGASTVSGSETRASGSQSPIVSTRSLLEGAGQPEQMWKLLWPAPELTEHGACQWGQAEEKTNTGKTSPEMARMDFLNEGEIDPEQEKGTSSGIQKFSLFCLLGRH